MDKKNKRKKSGHEFRQEKKNKLLLESAISCSKITALFKKPDGPSEDENLESHAQNKTFEEAEFVSFNLSSPSSSSNLDCSKMIYDNQFSDLSSDRFQGFKLVENLQTEEQDPNYLSPRKLEAPSLDTGNSARRCYSSVEESQVHIINYFEKPSERHLSAYLDYHPIQPDERELPFNDKKPLYTVKRNDGETFQRHWISYDENSKKLFCFICIVYSSNSNSTFCTGFEDWKHVHQRVNEHEMSKAHFQSVEAFMVAKRKKSTRDLLFCDQLDKRKQEVLERRHVVKIVIDVLKLIGKQGLAFRASKEAAYSLKDDTINHGNFLEIIMLMSKYDPQLEKHLKKAIEESDTRMSKRSTKKTDVEHEKKGKNKRVGRGSAVTFLSNNTVAKIMICMTKEIKSVVANEIKSAGKYSVLMDTTIDISSNDQCAIVARYVKGHEVCERLLALKSVVSTTGEALFDTLSGVLTELEIPLSDCVANAFDGASNMSGQYNGLTAQMASKIPNHIHTWCYAHVLNLVISDTAQCLTVTISFFSIMQETQVFLKDSIKRLDMFRKQNPEYKLEAIGATRWRSRSNAATKIFGRIDMWTSSEEQSSNTAKPNKHIYLELVLALFKISHSADFNAKVRHEATALLKKYLDFETVLVGMIFLQLFKITTPLSDYLQTKNLDYAQAWRNIESSLSRLKHLREKFDETLNAAQRFVLKMTQKLEERAKADETLNEIVIGKAITEKRKKKVKKMAGELAEDDSVGTSPEEEFKIKIFFVIVERAVQTMESRFVQHKSLYLDLACFDPKTFKSQESLPPKALKKIGELVLNVDEEKLKEELISFVNVWPQISNASLNADYENEDVSDEKIDAQEEKMMKTTRSSAKSRHHAIAVSSVHIKLY
ncbi:uncharacterized protein [Leptinotarsa decemlineata]|uniref:uncharacterized protein n=1 Tax=Leptinotarsa decemlineata TaxID=7539 RepID=UPI003D30A250